VANSAPDDPWSRSHREHYLSTIKHAGPFPTHPGINANGFGSTLPGTPPNVDMVLDLRKGVLCAPSDLIDLPLNDWTLALVARR
jgi:hypothetical protein